MRKAIKCYDDAGEHPWRKEECDKLAARAKAREKRDQADQVCKDKGLRFKGTIGDQVECEP